MIRRQLSRSAFRQIGHVPMLCGLGTYRCARGIRLFVRHGVGLTVLANARALRCADPVDKLSPGVFRRLLRLRHLISS